MEWKDALMVQVLQGSPQRGNRALQNSEKSVRALAGR
jgi:hypothetical protein